MYINRKVTGRIASFRIDTRVKIVHCQNMKICFSYLSILTVLCATTNAAKFPENLKRCRQKDPNLNECIRVSVTDAIRKMADGLPTLGISPLQPLAISAINLGQGSGPVNIRQEYTNIKLHGLCDSVLTTYNAQLDKYMLYTEAITPKMEFIADYVMNGRVIVLPVQGKGLANITMVGLKTTHTLIGEPFKKKGKQYMRLVDYKLTTEPKRVYFHFDNLFNGDPILAPTTLNFFNENWKDIYDEIKPQYEESFGIVFKDISNRIFTKVPFNEIFLE